MSYRLLILPMLCLLMACGGDDAPAGGADATTAGPDATASADTSTPQTATCFETSECGEGEICTATMNDCGQCNGAVPCARETQPSAPAPKRCGTGDPRQCRQGKHDQDALFSR